MAKKTPQTPAKRAKTTNCSIHGCVGTLRTPGTGLGCDNAGCPNFWERWYVAVQKDTTDEQERAVMLAAIAARKKKLKK